MVPLQTLVSVRNTSGPAIVNRYNMYPSAEINGNMAPGTSSGQAMAIMDALAKKELPDRMGFEWTELMYQQILAGNTAVLVFALGTHAGFPGALLPIRKLVAAIGHHPDRAHVFVGSHRRRLALQDG